MKLEKSILDKIYDISLKSAFAKTKEVFIFELGEMGDFLGKEKSEGIRYFFLKNNIKVKQISNISSLPEFSKNIDFINNVMSFRYVSKDIFYITNEILIFDDKIAIYNKNEFILIEDEKFSNNQKQLFMSIWEQGILPKLNFDYIPNHSFYNSVDLFVSGTQIIVWPDCDSKKSYSGFDKEKLKIFFENILEENTEKYKNSSYIISFIWNFKGNKMVDIWNFNENYVDDRSGPIGNASVYRNGKSCDNLGLASGNTLLILGYEEKIRRQSKNLEDYLNGAVPKMPLEIVNGKEFFD